MPIFKKPVEVLDEYGLKPSDITDVIITHSHNDHIEAVRYYENATIYIQSDEYELGKRYIPYRFKVKTFEDEIALTEDIVVKKVAGHSRGSSIVLANNYVFLRR